MVNLRLESLGASYGAIRVLDGITTPEFVSGEVVAVLGPNAAGKSTLLRRMAGMMRGDGRVVIDGAEACDNAFSYLPQDTGMGGMITVFESVLLACKQSGSWRLGAEDLDRVEKTLDDLDLLSFASRYLGDLSGGQRQLAGIAQCLVREPKILLMDEPTSALDLYHQIDVLTLVRKLALERGMIVIAALHDLNLTLRHTDQALVILNGRFYACGPSIEVVRPEMLRDVYKVSARVEPCTGGFRHVIVDAVLRDDALVEREG